MPKIDPRIISALEALEKDGRRLSPKDVVEAARTRRSPLHDFFEWDDSKAAESYRLQQAAMLIRSVRVDITRNQVPYRVPKYLLDPAVDSGSERRGYQATDMIKEHEDNARAALVEEMGRVAQAVRRARTVAVALGFLDDIETIEVLASRIIDGVKPSTVDDQPRGNA